MARQAIFRDWRRSAVCRAVGWIGGAFGALAVLFCWSAAPAACPFEHAHYVLDHEPGFTAGFQPIAKPAGWPTDVALFVHSRKLNKTYWFVFDKDQGARTYLIMTTDVRAKDWRPPGADVRKGSLAGAGYLALDAAHDFLSGLPARGAAAPEYMLLPDLPNDLWYKPDGDARIGVGLDLFELKSCDGKAGEPGASR